MMGTPLWWFRDKGKLKLPLLPVFPGGRREINSSPSQLPEPSLSPSLTSYLYPVNAALWCVHLCRRLGHCILPADSRRHMCLFIMRLTQDECFWKSVHYSKCHFPSTGRALY